MTATEPVSEGHTPGPWLVSKGSPQLVGTNDFWIASTMGIKGTEGEANARLIAAAPEMLTQLRNASWLLADISPDGLVKKQIDEVIAKATGAA